MCEKRQKNRRGGREVPQSSNGNQALCSLRSCLFIHDKVSTARASQKMSKDDQDMLKELTLCLGRNSSEWRVRMRERSKGNILAHCVEVEIDQEKINILILH